MEDDLTKYSLVNHQANTVVEALKVNFLYIHEIPDTILTDQVIDFVE